MSQIQTQMTMAAAKQHTETKQTAAVLKKFSTTTGQLAKSAAMDATAKRHTEGKTEEEAKITLHKSMARVKNVAQNIVETTFDKTQEKHDNRLSKRFGKKEEATSIL